MVRGLLVAIAWTIGRHGRSDLQLKEYSGWRADAVTAPTSLAVNVQFDCSRSFEGAATDNTSTSSIEVLRMDLV